MNKKLSIDYRIPNKILTPTGGFLKGYTHSVNPYSGCAFACSYCYVRQSPIGLFRKQEWGTWVDVKCVAREKILREMANLRKKGKPITLFMSSSTDPYQPMEYSEKVTRTILEAMIEMPPDFLFVQTRSPLVTRDIDLFVKLKDRLRISMTVETDLDSIRQTFTPYAPPIQARLRAVRLLRTHGLPVQIAVAPVLPFTDEFPEILSQHVERIVVDDFYSGDGSQGMRTARLNLKKLYTDVNIDWYSENTHMAAIEKLKSSFREDQIFLSQQGFMPF